MSKKKVSKKVKTTKNTKAPSKKAMSKNCNKSCKKSCDTTKNECSYKEKAFGESYPASSSSPDFEPPKEPSPNLWGKIKKFIGL